MCIALAVACGDDGGDPAHSGADATGSTGAASDDDDDDDVPGDDDDDDATGDDDDDDSTGGDDDDDDDDDDSTGDDDDDDDANTVPVFVAVGDGGWLATSCDEGQSWTHTQFSTEIGDHTPWTAFGGLAFGAEGFVAGFGWGAPGYLLWSGDGTTWEALPADAFLIDGTPTAYESWTSGVAHTGSTFVAFSQTNWGSTDGQNWTPNGIQLPPGSDQVRQLRGFPEEGLLVASLESQAGEGHPVGHFIVVSEDDGGTWTEGTGYDEGCSNPIQHWGDIEAHGDTLLVATGPVCRSTDRGMTWTSLGQPTGGEIQDLFDDEDDFWAVGGSRIFRSDDDGVGWNEVADVGEELRAGVYGGGVYVAVGPRGTAFFYSTDGETWMPATLDWEADGETWVRDLVVGGMTGGCVE